MNSPQNTRQWHLGKTELVVAKKRTWSSWIIYDLKRPMVLMADTLQLKMPYSDKSNPELVRRAITQIPVENHNLPVSCMTSDIFNRSAWYRLIGWLPIDRQDELVRWSTERAEAATKDPLNREGLPTYGEMINGIRRIMSIIDHVESSILNTRINPNNSPEAQEFMRKHRSQNYWFNYQYNHLWSAMIPEGMLQPKQLYLME